MNVQSINQEVKSKIWNKIYSNNAYEKIEFEEVFASYNR
jgi:hypothetical protein